MNKRLQRILDDQGAYTGNVCTDAQFSNFVRPENETECNGFTFQTGELRRRDLALFKPYPFAQRLATRFPRTTCILYVWRTRFASYGASITDTDSNLLERVILRGPSYKQNVLDLERLSGIRYTTTSDGGTNDAVLDTLRRKLTGVQVELTAFIAEVKEAMSGERLASLMDASQQLNRSHRALWSATHVK